MPKISQTSLRSIILECSGVSRDLSWRSEYLHAFQRISGGQASMASSHRMPCIIRGIRRGEASILTRFNEFLAVRHPMASSHRMPCIIRMIRRGGEHLHSFQ